MSEALQASLTGGELSPALHARVDLARYLTSLKTCRNFIVQPYGGVKNRPGFRFVGYTRGLLAAKLIPFQFSSTQNYVLEFTENDSIRIIKNGGYVVLKDRTAWVTSTFYKKYAVIKNGTSVYQCNTDHTSGTFVADLAAGYWSLRGTVGDIVRLNHTRSIASLFVMTYAQNADVVYFAESNSKPYELIRFDDDIWIFRIATIKHGPFQDLNVDRAIDLAVAGTSSPYTVTLPEQGYFSSDDVGSQLKIVTQNYSSQPWEAAKAVTIGDIRTNNFKYYEAASSATTGTKPPINEEYDEVWNDGGVLWEYKDSGIGYGTIDTYTYSAGVSMSVSTLANEQMPVGVAGAYSYKWAKGAWSASLGYPSCVCFFQQRLCFAGSTSFPQTVWTSMTGDYSNFGDSMPSTDEDSVTFTLASGQVNRVRHIIASDRMILLTTGGTWAIGTGDSDVLTPTNRGAKQQSYYGASTVRPLGVGGSVLYVEEMGQVVRDLGYDLASDKYMGDDLSVMANHLLEGKTIVDWTWQQYPNQCAWIVLDDGSLLSMTYKKEQAVVGWARHDTSGGLFESVCCIRESDEDALYAVINRTINGNVSRCVERMETRRIEDIEDAFFVDSGLTYNGWHTGSVTMTISGGTTWDSTDSVTVTASSATFSYPATSDVGDAIAFKDTNDRIIKLTITSLISTTVAKATPSTVIPVARRSAAFTDWGFARNSFSGAGHLEGVEVSVLADGSVLAPVTVVSGGFTLDYPYVVVSAGRPIESDLETLEPQLNGQALSRKKSIHSVSLMVQDTRGLWAGRSLDDLHEFKAVPGTVWDTPIQYHNGIITKEIPTGWSTNGSFAIQQKDPLPATILAIIPDIDVGG